MRPKPNSTMPLFGEPCWCCGFPADHLVITPIGREVVHQDAKRARCLMMNPPVPVPVVVPVRAPRELQPCGTPAAWHRHKRHGETPCDPCREAMSAHVMNLRAQKAGAA